MKVAKLLTNLQVMFLSLIALMGVKSANTKKEAIQAAELKAQELAYAAQNNAIQVSEIKAQELATAAQNNAISAAESTATTLARGVFSDANRYTDESLSKVALTVSRNQEFAQKGAAYSAMLTATTATTIADALATVSLKDAGGYAVTDGNVVLRCEYPEGVSVEFTDLPTGANTLAVDGELWFTLSNGNITNAYINPSHSQNQANAAKISAIQESAVFTNTQLDEFAAGLNPMYQLML